MGRSDSSSVEDDGLRRRNVPYFETQRRTSDEDDEDDEEFRLPERKEEKQGFSLNKIIVAALVLLCLGALFLSGEPITSQYFPPDQTPVPLCIVSRVALEYQGKYAFHAIMIVSNARNCY